MPDENSTIGIILCKEENKTVVEFTLAEDNKTIFGAEYKLYLPSKRTIEKTVGIKNGVPKRAGLDPFLQHLSKSTCCKLF